MMSRPFSETERQTMKGLQSAGYSWALMQDVALYIRNNTSVGHRVTSANIDPDKSKIKFSNVDLLTITKAGTLTYVMA